MTQVVRRDGDSPAVIALTGTRAKVSKELNHLDATQLLVLACQPMPKPLFDGLSFQFKMFGSEIADVLQSRHSSTVLRTLAEVVVPAPRVSEAWLKEQKMLVNARKAVVASGDWLTAAQVAELAGLSDINPSAQPSKWKKAGKIFAITHRGVDYYPSFGLDPDEDYRPRQAMAPIIKLLGETRDAWGLAYWFESANSFLGGKMPKTLMGNQPARVIEAAKDAVRGITHG